MMKKNLLSQAKSWQPDNTDKHGADKRKFVDFLIENCIGHRNARSILSIMRNTQFEHVYKKGSFQHNIIVPLRQEGKIFVGTCRRGVFLIESGEDAATTIEFYQSRIRAEQKHLRILLGIARKMGLFADPVYTKVATRPTKINVYLDESGVPSLKNLKQDPYFIVSAILVDNAKVEREISRKFRRIKEDLQLRPDSELKASRLSTNQIEYCLKELASVEYEFAAVCFVKVNLKSKGFTYPKSFYKYAFRFVVERILLTSGAANLFFDEY
ncbi:MAG: DUF3800 domain-containing protein, partial [Candidatus Zixiibacteriota bacterium]